MDLVQAEAVRDLIDAVTPLQARAAFDQLDGTLTTRIREIDSALFDLSARVEASLDFPEEGYHFVGPGRVAEEVVVVREKITALLSHARRGRLIREGARVAILGRPNAGKSTLFNALAGARRAIVTDTPGTTRDLVTEVVDIDGLPLTLVDTAGLRVDPSDAVEIEGIARARSAAAVADLLLVVLDGSRAVDEEDRRDPRGDCRSTSGDRGQQGGPSVGVERRRTSGAIRCAPDGTWPRRHSARRSSRPCRPRSPVSDTPTVTNLRHVALLERALSTLQRAGEAAAAGVPEEFVAADHSRGAEDA